MPEPLFDKFAGLRPVTLLKRDSATGVLLRVLQNFSRTSVLQNTSRLLYLAVRIFFLRNGKYMNVLFDQFK